MWYNAGMTEQLDMLLWELAEQQPWLLPVCFALFGACVGSFLNVVIYRTPRGLSVNEPRRSFCPSCNKEIPWYLNIPLVSWLMLRGRSACCRQRISMRYWLVELACALLFAGVAWQLGEGQSLSAVAQVLICAWVATGLAMLCIDWEQMIVLPKMALVATGLGIAAVLADPVWFYETASMGDAFLLAAGSGVMGFILLKLVALLGRICFGHKKKSFADAQAWELKQEGEEDLLLTIGNTTYLWSELFMEENNRVHLDGAMLRDKEHAAGTITFTAESFTLPDGSEHRLEDYESLAGSCRGMRTRREAMGSGDAWIALSLGVVCGWQGACFALAAGSVLGILWAIIARVSKGEPMPFGPAFIAGAWLYLAYGRGWVESFIHNMG